VLRLLACSGSKQTVHRRLDFLTIAGQPVVFYDKAAKFLGLTHR